MYTFRDGPVIKGNREGLRIILDGRMEPGKAVASLKERIEAADDFFRDAKASVEIMEMDWGPADTEMIRELLSRFNITVESIASGCQENDGREKSEEAMPQNGTFEQLQQDIYDLLSTEAEQAAERGISEEKFRDQTLEQPKNTSLVRRTLRSGQHVQFNGNVVVMGDVNPGAEITASGDILVFGAFRGVAHAGANGDEQAVVAALKLQPTQLRIANYISRAPDQKSKAPSKPEIARIRAGNIEIETFLA
jgi:septum site-determining protein MinC